MKKKIITTCPVCSETLRVSHLSCDACGSVLQGEFESCRYCRLPQDVFDFLDVFLKCRGSISDIEKEIGMSYPAVKSRIEKLMGALGYSDGSLKNRDEKRQEILEAVRDGATNVEGAILELRKL